MRAIGYVRVSTTKQDLTRQESLIQDYCKINNIDLVEIISDKQSGTVADREGYIRLLQTDKSDADAIIMTELSRLSRQEDIVTTLGFINELLKRNIDIIVLENSTSYSTTFKGGKTLQLVEALRIIIELDAASKERRKILDRMTTGKKTKFLNCDNAGVFAIAPLGYKLVENPNYKQYETPKKILIRDEDEIALVKDIFNMRLNGLSAQDIADKLEAMGITSNHGTPYTKSSILYILHNTCYIGEWHYGKTTRKGDAIIDREIFDKVQELVNQGRVTYNKTVIKHFNMLKGLIRCSCGSALTIYFNNKIENGGIYYYKCCSQISSDMKLHCNNGGINKECVDTACWNAVVSSLSSKEFNIKTNEEVKKINIVISQIEKDIEVTENRIKQLEKEQSKLSIRIAKIDNEQLVDSLIGEYEKDQKQIDELKKNLTDLSLKKQTNKILKDQIQEKANKEELENATEEQKSIIFHKLIDKVVYYSEKVRRGFLVIYFKNGGQIAYLITTSSHCKNLLTKLPSSFVYNPETKKIQVQYMSSGMSFETKIVEYTSKELQKNFKQLLEENVLIKKGSPK